MNNFFVVPSHSGERDYETLLLAHGLLDSIEKHDGNVQFVISTKGVETLLRIGMAMQSNAVAPASVQHPTEGSNATDTDKLITKKEAQQMLNVCDATLWTWAKRKYLVPVKIGSRNHYRLSDVKRIMEGKTYA
jgi:hypothetical protein